jgi:alpha-tubulin suppressor-like RCC1 family protein
MDRWADVSGGLQFKATSAGYRHTCAIITAGAAYCWGDNEYGQLGSVAVTGSAVPVAVPFQ